MLHLLFYSLPVQLLFFHAKRNLALLSVWVGLGLVVTGQWGRSLGLPFLFLAPEYQGQVSFASLALMGVALGSFVMSFHLTSFILGINRFPFLGFLRYPLARFCFNNSLVPVAFVALYIEELVRYQRYFEGQALGEVLWLVAGLLTGLVATILLSVVYFHYTGVDRFRRVVDRVDRRLRQNALSRYLRAQKLRNIQGGRSVLKSYLDFPFRLRRIQYNQPVGPQVLLQIFDQNQFNAIALQAVFFLFFLALGWFPGQAWLQIPAAATALLLFAFGAMLLGAAIFWLRGWALTVSALVVGGLGWFLTDDGHGARHQAFGVNYAAPWAEYTAARLHALSTEAHYRADTAATRLILDRWRQKFPPGTKPRLVLVCTSGGGQRAAVWAVRCLQVADSATQGGLMRHTQLMTGASGGMIGAAYFREVWHQAQLGRVADPYHPRFVDNIAKDRLNALVFSLVTTDLGLWQPSFAYQGRDYGRDRGQAFEEKLNADTELLLDKPLAAYRQPEAAAQVPMLLLAPTVVNDGRRLYISPQGVSYLTTAAPGLPTELRPKLGGIEFGRFFAQHGADSLRFLSALRMSATFPYITPNVTLPSQPAMQVMDAGLSDNFGVADAVRFVFVFREWLARHTSGVVLVRIRDSPREAPIPPSVSRSLLFRLFTPIEHLVANLDHLQDARNEALVGYARGWFAGELHTIDFQYGGQADGARPATPHEAPLSWRLTAKERDGIKALMQSPANQHALRDLQQLLR
jgi:hypothetical protein